MNLKSKLNTAIAISAFALMALLSGCEYEFVEPEKAPPIATEVSFANDIIPIFNASCNLSGCHAVGAFSPILAPSVAFSNLTQGTKYVNTANPSQSLIYTAMATGSMKSFSTPAQANLVLAWIQQGALNN